MMAFTTHSHNRYPWSKLSDLDPNTKSKIANAATNDYSSGIILSKDHLNASLKNMEHYLAIIHQELEYLSRYIARPHSFIFSEPRGYALSVLNVNHEIDIKLGTSFNILHMGINAIGIAKVANKMSIITGREHTSNLFWDYSCVCTPLQVSNKMIGYLDLTFQRTEDITFSLPLMKQLSKNIEERLIKLCPTLQKEKVYSLFNRYNMTSREKEIAYAWLNNFSCEEIANMNSISPHTVRTHLKNIYSKTDTVSKGEFFLKFKI